MYCLCTGWSRCDWRNRRSMQQTKEQVEQTGRSFQEIIVDLSQKDAVSCIMEACDKLCSRVDILVNNAGIILREDAKDVSEEGLG